GQNKGMDLLGIPGLNGPRAFEGGMPVFDFNTYQDIGITELYMPYYRNDDQSQTVVNLNWTKGRHNVRAGTDIYFQALNHTQPEWSGGDNYGARGGVRFRPRSAAAERGAVGEQFQRVGRVPARTAGPARTIDRDGSAVHHTHAQLQLL